MNEVLLERKKAFAPFILISQKDMVEIFGSLPFLKQSQEWLEDGTFDYTHFIPSHGGKSLSVWSRKGMSCLEEFFFISKELESEFLHHLYYFEEVLIFPTRLYEAITKKYNIRNPESTRSEKEIEGFFRSGYATFREKNKHSMEIYLDIMKEIRSEIIDNEFISDYSYKKHVKFEEFKC